MGAYGRVETFLFDRMPLSKFLVPPKKLARNFVKFFDFFREQVFNKWTISFVVKIVLVETEKIENNWGPHISQHLLKVFQMLN